jgi:SAM-dependent methyltransferase
MEESAVSVSRATGDRRTDIYQRMLDQFRPGRLADLGAGHGTFSVLAADKGWQVTAIDARTERFPDDPRVTWLQSDVRDADLSQFDLIVCLGLFYHLTLSDQLDLLKRCSGTPLLIDTHLAVGVSTHALSKEVSSDGYTGRLYDEVLSSALASWVNEKSFWPNRESFWKMLEDNGYGVVMTVEPWYLPDRTFFLCLPGTPAHPANRFSGTPTEALRDPSLLSPGTTVDGLQTPTQEVVSSLRRHPAVAQVAKATGPVRRRLSRSTGPR